MFDLCRAHALARSLRGGDGQTNGVTVCRLSTVSLFNSTLSIPTLYSRCVLLLMLLQSGNGSCGRGLDSPLGRLPAKQTEQPASQPGIRMAHECDNDADCVDGNMEKGKYVHSFS